ncbi:MAG: sigma-54-dependent Fis family transcriptional regulator [Candidatus Krumholzibacteriota bacterium]|nr:sigma-54-dependent Fis family transcriptional regulator [Candidatus Krumholzibacteriota bacterium]
MSLRLDLVSYGKKGTSSLRSDCEEAGWKVTHFPSLDDYLGAPERAETPLLILAVPVSWKADEVERRLRDLKIRRRGTGETQLVLLLPRKIPGGDRLALELGARHVLYRPYQAADLTQVLSQIAQGLGKRVRKKALYSRLQPPQGFEKIIGVSSAIRETIDLAERVGKSEFTTVMITGENGTGKGALAQAIHSVSSRGAEPFIEVNCAAIPRALLESEFFGYEKGAFTDAKERKIGLFECANGGTIFLDEVGEIDYGLQAKLLKFLDSRTIRRVSGTQFLPVDVRIISATNRNLKEDIEGKRFRIDLYYRLNVVEINLPPLRERIEDIRPLAEAYTRKFAGRLKKGELKLSEEALRLLEEYPWPGNIRELINLIERAVLLNTNGEIEPKDLPLKKEYREITVGVRRQRGTVKVDLPPAGAPLEEVEKGLIEAALSRTGGNIAGAARLLEIERGMLRYKMKKHGIEASRTKKVCPQT